MEFKRKRWISLFAGVLMEAFCGICYAWSVFQAPLMEQYGWSVSQVSLTYTISFLCTMLVSLLLSKTLRRVLSTRREVLLGSILYAGFLMAIAFINGHLLLLYLFYGIFSGIGVAMVYPVLISYAVELFPDRSGFAGGLMTAGFGLGSVLWAPLGTKIYAATGDIGNAFLVLGGIFLVGMVALSFLIFEPPTGFRAQMLTEKVGHSTDTDTRKTTVSIYDVGKREMLKLPLFFIAFLTLLLGLGCGGMIVNQGSPIIVHRFGLSAATAAVIVSMLSVSNVIGRLGWGILSDQLGKARSLVLIHALMAFCMLGLLVIDNQAVFIAVLLGTTLCYGGFSSIVAPLTAELFGDKHVGENYSVTFSAFGLSSLVGPALISSIRDATGEYTLGFVCAAAFAAIGILLSLILVRAQKKCAQAQKDAAVRA